MIGKYKGEGLQNYTKIKAERELFRNCWKKFQDWGYLTWKQQSDSYQTSTLDRDPKNLLWVFFKTLKFENSLLYLNMAIYLLRELFYNLTPHCSHLGSFKNLLIPGFHSRLYKSSYPGLQLRHWYFLKTLWGAVRIESHWKFHVMVKPDGNEHIYSLVSPKFPLECRKLF